MITAEKLSFSFPNKILFDNISFTVSEKEHCALIGTGGSGKSTLADIITGNNKYLYDGKMEVAKSCKIGYTYQFYKHEKSATTVFDYIAESFVAAQNNLDALCDKMGSAEDIEAAMEEYQNALDEFEAIGGNDYHATIMKKLGVAELSERADLPIANLSGGEFKLVQLIKEMISGQDLLIMDEPDVFLDFDNLHSLKCLINAHKGTLLVITHNRYLLNECFNKILHLENTKLAQYEGNYTEYNLYLTERKIELMEQALSDKIEIQRNEKLIEDLREIATENADAMFGKTLKARVKLMERLKERRTQEPFIYTLTPDFTLKNSEIDEAGSAIKVENFTLSYEKPLINDASFEINYGEKVALIGANGTGKTSLLRAILKNESAGIKIAENAKIAYLSQQKNETLSEENSIYDEFFSIGLKSYEDIENYLISYNFEKEVLSDKISTLSGGEKNILQMAKFGMISADVLVLDEPSGHLDIYCQLALENALMNFKGTVLMVSHDFYFIANCMDYVLMIENKSIRKMSGRKFRKMIYAKHYKKDYLLLQEKYTHTIGALEKAIAANQFDKARKLHEDAKSLYEAMK